MIERKSTKELLQSSLYDLLRETPYEKITVTELAKNCGVSQRAFYNHFRDKHDLAEWSYLHAVDQSCEKRRGEIGEMSLREWLSITTETAWECRLILQKCIRYRGQNNLRVSLHQPLTERCLALLEEISHEPLNQEARDAVSFFMGGLISYVERALDAPEIPAPEESLRIFESCVPVCLREFLTDERSNVTDAIIPPFPRSAGFPHR